MKGNWLYLENSQELRNQGFIAGEDFNQSLNSV